MSEKEMIDLVEKSLNGYVQYGGRINKFKLAHKLLLKKYKEYKEELELKDKVIDEMAKVIDDYDVQFHINNYKNIEHIKEVFTNKVKENAYEDYNLFK